MQSELRSLEHKRDNLPNRKILKDFRPDVVIGTGGYVCGPILLAAALSHIPTMVQEQNVIPGITNKILRNTAR